MRSVHFNVIQCCKIVEVSFKMASCRGATFRKNLPALTCSPETVSENLENEIPMDVTEEISGDTDSVSSDEPVLSQSTAKLSLPVKLTRENARQNIAAVESGPSKTVSGWYKRTIWFSSIDS